MAIVSSDVKIQEIMQECKDIVARKDIKAALKCIEDNSRVLEEQGQIIESAILWEFFADLSEKLEEEEVLSYAYGKLITRYLLLENYEKANTIYQQAIEKGLQSFYLDTAINLLLSRKTKPEHLEIKEIAKIEEQDIFGDYNQIVASPNIPFRSFAEIKRYVEEYLPKGTYRVHIFNKNSKTFETTTITTESLTEYEVINIETILEVRQK